MTSSNTNFPGKIGSATGLGFAGGILVELVIGLAAPAGTLPQGMLGLLAIPALGAVIGGVMGFATSS